ncbi:type IV pilus assembly protein PilM [Candidatus Dojkabacteria bacterium]|nr:type IV pilus assembly protein PilM [Candidatus Dojkabacteria bacterium]
MNLPDFFGLDIGNHSIKVVQVKRKSETQASLVALGSSETPFGVIGSENEQHKKELAENIKSLLESADIGTKKVVAALPESAIFTRLAVFPDLVDKELEDAIHWEAKQYIPLPLENVNLEWLKVGERQEAGQKKNEILLVAAPKTLVDSYTQLASLAGLELIALETETVATTRAITFKQKMEETAMILDFGANGTDMSVIKGKNPIFSQTLGTGSDALTKAISLDFGLDVQQAEQYKRTYGLDQTKVDGKIFKSLDPIMQVIVSEITKTLNFFRAHFQANSPKKIYIVGDGAILIGLPEYLSSKLGLLTERFDPLSNLEKDKKVEESLKSVSGIGYTVAVGLALKAE